MYILCYFFFFRILFWTDWDSSMPRIEAASMSGEGRRTIHKETGSGGWPNGLTVDYQEERILWIDARYSFTIYQTLNYIYESSVKLQARTLIK